MKIDIVYDFILNEGPKTFKEIVDFIKIEPFKYGDFWSEISFDTRFFCMKDGKWDLASRHTFDEKHKYEEVDDEEEFEDEELEESIDDFEDEDDSFEDEEEFYEKEEDDDYE